MLVGKRHICRVTLCLVLLFLGTCISGYCLEHSLRKVTDQVGREILVPLVPSRLVALSPSITEIVFAVGASDRLVGVTTFSDYPPEAKSIFKVGSYVSLDIERIVSLSPDLVIAVKDGNPKAAVERIESFGIPVFVTNPVDLESVIESVRLLGDILGCSKKAGQIVQDMRHGIEEIKNKVSNIKHRPRIFFQVGISPIISAGRNTFIDELIELAGGINVVGDMEGYPRFSAEEVIALSPDFILVATMDVGGGFKNARSFWKRFPMIPAAANNRVFLVPSDLVNRPSPRLVSGLRVIAEIIHPECFGKIVPSGPGPSAIRQGN